MFPYLDFHELQLKATQTVLFTQKIYLYSHWDHRQIKDCSIPVTIVIDFQPLTITTKSFIRGDAAVLDLHLGNIF